MNLYVLESSGEPEAVIIWMHGLGADSSDMMGLAQELSLSSVSVRHLFIDAPVRAVTFTGGMEMTAWHDIVALDSMSGIDIEGVKSSEQMIRQVIDEQMAQGLTSQQIYLAGFSQGGAMALHTALHSSLRLGGVVALSAYLPLGNESVGLLDKDTPFFMATGRLDSVVKPLWTHRSYEWISAQGYQQIAYHQYDMEHSVCAEEIADLSHWLLKNIQGAA